MKKEQITEELKILISNITEIDINILDEKKSIWDDLCIDSLDFETIICVMEEKYEIDISNDEYEEIETIEDILNLIIIKMK